MPRRLRPSGGGQGQRDIPCLLQTRLGGRHPGQTHEGGPKAGWAVGLPATTPRENPQQRSPPHPAQVPAVGRLPADAFKKRKYKSGLLNTYIPESPVTNKHRGRLLFWIRACRQKALYCACRAPFHSFYSIYLLLFENFQFYFSFFLCLHYVVVSASKSAQTTLKFIHSVQMALWD